MALEDETQVTDGNGLFVRPPPFQHHFVHLVASRGHRSSLQGHRGLAPPPAAFASLRCSRAGSNRGEIRGNRAWLLTAAHGAERRQDSERGGRVVDKNVWENSCKSSVMNQRNLGGKEDGCEESRVRKHENLPVAATSLSAHWFPPLMDFQMAVLRFTLVKPS